ncbi:hypothetical protein I308_106684 [Cryptococcus tetragattii IND107]|uniref:Uncharacterized protein n=1 Tax=Cryptococcus tetragattii IND107 TaxID=1296105 RepID=A0ABR3BIF4_9TREE
MGSNQTAADRRCPSAKSDLTLSDAIWGKTLLILNFCTNIVRRTLNVYRPNVIHFYSLNGIYFSLLHSPVDQQGQSSHP